MKIQGWGKEYEVELVKKKYTNGNLAITLNYYDEEFGCFLPYGNLTVNLGKKLPPDMAYVDTNNMEDAEEFIEQYDLGEHQGKFGFSGYCCYPLYKFK